MLGLPSELSDKLSEVLNLANAMKDTTKTKELT